MKKKGQRKGKRRQKRIDDHGHTSREESEKGTAQLLNELRVITYKEMCAKGKVHPERLPPSEGAAEQHSLRCYLQVHDCNWMKHDLHDFFTRFLNILVIHTI